MSNKMRKFFVVLLVVIATVVVTMLATNLSSQGTTNLNSGSYRDVAMEYGSMSDSSTQFRGSVIPEQSYDKQDPTKIIKKSNITMQTDRYTDSLQSIYNLINSSEAMIVRMQENQGDYYDIMRPQSSKPRFTEIIIKVKKDRFESFNDEIKNYANVISYYEEAQDISSNYADIESKIESYKLQEKQLNELLKKATAAKDLLEISNQTQSVIQQREYLQRQKDSYDNQISYSTVTVKLMEVGSVQITEKDTFTRMKDTFKSSIDQIKDIFINIVMLIVYITPYVVILLIIILIVSIISKVRKK